MSLSWVLPIAVFEQLGRVLQQMVPTDEPTALLLTETVLTATPPAQMSVDRFVVAVSPLFSGLLQATTATSEDARITANDRVQSATDTSLLKETYQVTLTFEPAAIASFLNQLSHQLHHDSPVVAKLIQASQQCQPNDATVQSEFTLRLAAALTTPPSEPFSCDTAVAAALQQQVEQERTLNQVTAQIRQSIDLPMILQTAVQEVRQSLQVDRVVIYEFGSAPVQLDADASVDHSAWQPDFTSIPAAPLSSGRITYEALAVDTLPSALHLEEGLDCFAHRPIDPQKYTKRYVLAIDDTEIAYAALPCLLKLLQQVKVRAKLVVPILVEGERWGLLIVHQCAAVRHWQEREKNFLQRVAEHLAIAIRQARLYARLQQQKQMLEQRVIERTQELHDTLLAAQAADRAKTDFLAAMSHELRTPLTCVIGMAETLLRAMALKPGTHTLQPEKQQEYLKIIKRSGEHLLELINDILDVSQVEAGKTILSVKPFSLSQVAHQSLQMLRDRAQAKGVELSVIHLSSGNDRADVATQTDVITADPRRVSQILLNLLSNAIKFTLEGGHVTLRYGVNSEAAIFQVEDTGIGIPQEQRHLLFQKFQQLDSSYHRTYEGTGLGLALTKQLVELHGGTIEVNSTVGVGSIFTVRLPLQPKTSAKADHADAAIALETQSSDAMLSAADATILAGGRVVLIDDHEETAMLICDLLIAAGCQVVWMVDGQTALKQIEVLQPSLVITEVQLMGMDGFEVMQFLRHHPTLKTTKILVLTATTAADQHRYLAAGADDYLIKPIQPYQLLDKVVALMGQGLSNTA